MATLLDVGLLGFFLPIFTFLFVFAVVYAIVQKIKIFGESKTVHLTIAFALAMMSLFSGTAIELINFVTPWFVVLFIFIILFFMILMFLGTGEKEIWDKIGGITTILVIVILIIIIGLSQVLGPVFTPFANGGEKTIGGEALRTLFHPRLLGMILILLVSAFAISAISRKVK